MLMFNVEKISQRRILIYTLIRLNISEKFFVHKILNSINKGDKSQIGIGFSFKAITSRIEFRKYHMGK